MSRSNPGIKLDRISYLIWLVGSLLGLTWRVSISEKSTFNPIENPGEGNIFTIWHSHILFLAYIFRKSNATAMVSNSEDGKRAAAVAQKWKYNIIFGSSTRNGFTAFRQCMRAIQSGKNIVITPDGPRGPREQVKAGVAQISILTNSPVIPISASVGHYWRLKSWDRMIIPKPFSRIELIIGQKIVPENNAQSEEQIELLRRTIEANLHAITMA